MIPPCWMDWLSEISLSLTVQISITNAAGDAPTCRSLGNKSDRAGVCVIILDLDVSFKVELKWFCAINLYDRLVGPFFFFSHDSHCEWVLRVSWRVAWFNEEDCCRGPSLCYKYHCICRGMNWDSGTSGLLEVRPTGIQKFSWGRGLVMGFDPMISSTREHLD